MYVHTYLLDESINNKVTQFTLYALFKRGGAVDNSITTHYTAVTVGCIVTLKNEPNQGIIFWEIIGIDSITTRLQDIDR